MPPRIYAGLGPDSLVPQLRPQALASLKLGAEEGFVLSRVDGRLTVAQICLLVPFDPALTVEILKRLSQLGAVEIPGSEVAQLMEEIAAPRTQTGANPLVPSPTGTLPPVAPPPSRPLTPPSSPRVAPPAPQVSPPQAPPPQASRPITPPSSKPITPPSSPKVPSPKVPSPQVEGLELTVEQARRIDEFFQGLDHRDAFELLELPRTDDKKEIKRAYFKLSKEFHPDRFFNKNLGPYRERLSKIFQSIKAAFELLSDDERRAAYLESQK